MTIDELQQKKAMGQKISMLTCYDYAMAKILSRAGVDMLLVGDSLGMVVLGYSSTRDVTMDDMVRHTAAVARGAAGPVIVGDMPYGSYENPGQALDNAKRLLDAGAHMIKVERGREIRDVITALVQTGIPVMGHLGLTPQTAENFRVQGRETAAAMVLREDALLLSELGVHSMVLESMPRSLAKEITLSLRIPTIGIGAGPDTDGQVLVLYDMLGLFDDFRPKFVKPYADLSTAIESAVRQYAREVAEGIFPDDTTSFT